MREGKSKELDASSLEPTVCQVWVLLPLSERLAFVDMSGHTAEMEHL